MLELDPQIIVWEYTLKCDSKCIHCGSSAYKSDKDELNTKESLDLVKQIAEVGFKRVILSGGEPVLRKDWYRVGKEIKKENLEFGIISNALSWNNKTIETISKLQPFAIGFSVDGEEKLHDYLRGISGSHKKVFDTIKELRRKGQTICVVTSVNNKNIKELSKIRNRLIVYGVDAWQIQLTSPMGRMKNHKDLILNGKEHYNLGKFIVETREKLPLMNVQAGDCIGYFGKLEKRIRDNKWEGCMAGIKGLGIDSNGDVRGCLSIREDFIIEGNIRDKKLKEIWENPKGFLYNRSFNKTDLKGRCVGCYHGKKCRGGCQSQSVAFFNEFHNAPYCFYNFEK